MSDDEIQMHLRLLCSNMIHSHTTCRDNNFCRDTWFIGKDLKQIADERKTFYVEYCEIMEKELNKKLESDMGQEKLSNYLSDLAEKLHVMMWAIDVQLADIYGTAQSKNGCQSIKLMAVHLLEERGAYGKVYRKIKSIASDKNLDLKPGYLTKQTVFDAIANERGVTVCSVNLKAEHQTKVKK